MPGEPAGGRRRQGRVEAAGGQTDDHAEDDLELHERRSPARRHQAEPEQRAAGEHDGPGAEPVRERAPDEGPDAHAQPVDERGRRDARARPAHCLGHGLQEHGERGHRAESHARHHDPHPDDDPAVEELHRRSSSPDSRTARLRIDIPRRRHAVAIRSQPGGARPRCRASRWIREGARAASGRRRRMLRGRRPPAGSRPSRHHRRPG